MSFLYFRSISINFYVSGVFWSISKFQRHFGHFLGFGGISVTFLGLGDILVIFRFQEYFDPFLGFEGDDTKKLQLQTRPKRSS